MDTIGSRTQARSTFPPDLRGHAEELFHKGWTPTQVREELEADARFEGRQIPSRKTLQRWANALVSRDLSGPFTLLDVSESLSKSEIAERVASVLREAAMRTEGRVTSLTRHEAALAAAARTFAPDLPAWTAYLIARTAARRVEHEQDTVDLEQYLSFAPWRDDEASLSYWGAVGRAIVPEPPTVLWRANADTVDLIVAEASSEYPASRMFQEAVRRGDSDLAMQAVELQAEDSPVEQAARIAQSLNIRPVPRDPEGAAQFVTDFYAAFPEMAQAAGEPPDGNDIEGLKEHSVRLQEAGLRWLTGWTLRATAEKLQRRQSRRKD